MCEKSNAELLDNTPTLYYAMRSIADFDKKWSEQTEIINLAEKTRDKFFYTTYPLSRNVNKKDFEIDILNHFLTRRIAFETVTMFRIALVNKLREIMPKYNLMFDLLAKEIELFHTNYNRNLSEKTDDDHSVRGTKDSNRQNEYAKEGTEDITKTTDFEKMGDKESSTENQYSKVGTEGIKKDSTYSKSGSKESDTTSDFEKEGTEDISKTGEIEKSTTKETMGEGVTTKTVNGQENTNEHGTIHTVETTDKDTTDSGTENTTNSNTTNTTGSSTENVTDNISKITDKDTVKHEDLRNSDTPQNALADVRNGAYVSEYNYNTTDIAEDTTETTAETKATTGSTTGSETVSGTVSKTTSGTGTEDIEKVTDTESNNATQKTNTTTENGTSSDESNEETTENTESREVTDRDWTEKGNTTENYTEETLERGESAEETERDWSENGTSEENYTERTTEESDTREVTGREWTENGNALEDYTEGTTDNGERDILHELNENYNLADNLVEKMRVYANEIDSVMTMIYNDLDILFLQIVDY